MNELPTNDEGATDGAAVPSSPRVARLRARTRRRRITWSVVAAAVALAVIVAVGLTVTTSSTSADFSARLRATAVAPSADASANFTQNKAGFRVVLAARGLPTLSAGRYYEAWLQNSSGTLAALGTFTSSHNRLTLWSGVSPSDFPLMSVSLEEADGDHASLGPRVLVGEVHAR